MSSPFSFPSSNTSKLLFRNIAFLDPLLLLLLPLLQLACIHLHICVSLVWLSSFHSNGLIYFMIFSSEIQRGREWIMPGNIGWRVVQGWSYVLWRANRRAIATEACVNSLHTLGNSITAAIYLSSLSLYALGLMVKGRWDAGKERYIVWDRQEGGWKGSYQVCFHSVICPCEVIQRNLFLITNYSSPLWARVGVLRQRQAWRYRTCRVASRSIIVAVITRTLRWEPLFTILSLRSNKTAHFSGT